MTGSILIVSDDQAIVRVLSRCLTDVGHTVTTAYEGMDVERYCLDDQCDVVLVEAGLPYLNGMELLEAVNSANASVEVIMLVNSNSPTGIGEYLEGGAFDALVVPDEVVSQHRVVSLVRHALEISSLEQKQSQSKKMESLGAGEILLTSIDMDGTKDGYDVALTKKIVDSVSIPVVASGGCGKPEDMIDVFKKTDVEAALAASIFHYETHSVNRVKELIKENGIPVRI